MIPYISPERSFKFLNMELSSIHTIRMEIFDSKEKGSISETIDNFGKISGKFFMERRAERNPLVENRMLWADIKLKIQNLISYGE